MTLKEYVNAEASAPRGVTLRYFDDDGAHVCDDCAGAIERGYACDHCYAVVCGECVGNHGEHCDRV